MTIECDHTSVGVLVYRQEKLLLIERRRPPFGFAPPSGHVDQRASYEEAAKSELYEEVGLTVISLKLLIEGRQDNPCRRPGGNWHYWRIYEAATRGEPIANDEEVKRTVWRDPLELEYLAARTLQYTQNVIDPVEWQLRPGLEPVWLDWLVRLGTLNRHVVPRRDHGGR